MGAADLPTALARVSFTWLVSQPVAAAQLVLVTAAEGRSLVGATSFASVLPLAASGESYLCKDTGFPSPLITFTCTCCNIAGLCVCCSGCII